MLAHFEQRSGQKGDRMVGPSYFGNGLNILTPSILQIGGLAGLNN